MNNIELLDQVLAAVVSPAPPPHSPYLEQYFAVLKRGREARHREAAEHRIWQVWCSHDDTDGTDAMTEVLKALARNNLGEADQRLGDMLATWPDWAEVWNKRATLRFAQERYDECLNDILRTLELEPRHFGALAGFGQICLKARDPSSALIAFEQALQINPNLDAVREATEALQQTPRHIH